MRELFKKISKELSNLEDKKEKLAQQERLKELWEKYDGDDRIISSEELMKELEEERKKERLKIYTGIPTLDRKIEGFREGNLVVISAPTKNGKTSLCQSFTKEFSKQATSCLWFSYEVPIIEFLDKFGEKPPTFYVPRQIKGNTITWLEERIIESIAKNNTKVVFIDHLHYIVDMNAKNQNMSLQIGATMRSLKKIALRFNIIIFLIAHMKHVKLFKEPEIEDLRDSSFIGQEADIVLMLWRLKDKQTDEMLNETNLVIRAHRRTGETGKIPLIYENNKFKEITTNYE